jgi:transposase
MQTQVTKIDFNGQNIYVGIDTHLKSWKVSLYHDDIALKVFSQEPDPLLLVRHLRRNFPNATFKCAYEAGYSGFWIQKALNKKGLDCIVVNPADVPTTDKEKKLKTDKRDCRKIARSLRNNDLKAIYVPSDEGLEERQIIRFYRDMVKNRTRAKNKIKALLSYYGFNYIKEFNNANRHWTRSFIKWLKSLKLKTEAGNWVLQSSIQEYEHTRDKVKDAIKQVHQLSQYPKYAAKVRLLRSIPGIGITNAMIILTEIEDIHRFNTLDELCGYIGLIPNTNSTGEKERIGGMTNRGNANLKTVIIEAAWMALRYDPALLVSYKKLKLRMEANKAIIRIARKLVNRVRFVLKNETEYQTSII